jgi:TQO small subunit DoxD
MWTAWHRYWFAPAPCFDLAVVRIVACTLQLYLILSRHQYNEIQLQAALDDAVYDPIVILNMFHLFLGWGFRPGFEILGTVFFISIAAGALSLIGLLTNLSLVVFAATSVYLQAYLYSFGDFHHPEAVMMIALSLLALSPSGRVLSLDAWLRRRRRDDAASMLDVRSEFAGWPLKLIQWFFVLMYLSAVWSKLSLSGLDWANGYTLQFYLARDGFRWGSPFGVWMSQFHLFILLGQIGVLLFQSTFALAVIFPKLRWIYVPAGLGLHVMIFLTLRAPFFQWIALYAVFIPWSEAVRLVRDQLKGSGRSSPVPQ